MIKYLTVAVAFCAFVVVGLASNLDVSSQSDLANRIDNAVMEATK
jgi:hypothetical protein